MFKKQVLQHSYVPTENQPWILPTWDHNTMLKHLWHKWIISLFIWKIVGVIIQKVSVKKTLIYKLLGPQEQINPN